MEKGVIHMEQQLKSAIALLQELKDNNIPIDMDESMLLSKQFESCKSDYLNSLQKDLLTSKEKLIQEMQEAIKTFDETFTNATQDIISELNSGAEAKKEARSGIFSQKVHKVRSSLLNRMYQNEDARTVYHIFIAIMLIMILGEMLNTYISKGVLIDLSLFTYVFGDIYAVTAFWFLMAGWSFLIVPLVRVIHDYKLTIISWLPMYTLMQFIGIIVPCAFCIYRKLPIASGFIITCEFSRMFMKTHSYLREKLLFANGENEWATYIPDGLKKKGVTLESLNLPVMDIKDLNTEFRRYCYFFFAPTLIFRDSYPRIPTPLKFSNIFIGVTNVIGTIFYTFIIFQAWCVPYFQESWKESYNLRFILFSWFRTMIPGTMLLILMFFGMLHSWFNMWAEILRFGDRQFYTDWWNVSNFADYYRKWNIVVHEWLFHYVYQDMLRFSRGKCSQLQCFFAVFIISALMHELILAVSMQFFYPILLVMFGGPGVIYTFFSRRDSRFLNVFVWSMFFVGNGLLVVFYSWEHFARKSMDLTPKYGWKTFFIPHSWGCFE
ncbi:hypothetical protein SteCoe_19034 [Stentor coeruleus]|uniref:O-acyltransferase n=1 Tax=Stentor coeruleus TaxID=5963 RepID=A0A1R2BVH2_9CILI|nr:hypothetical protein SteCoe_19034 [Stentor coeruleus]